jgi:hypothetical protein
LTIYSPAPGGGSVLDDAAAIRWQAETLAKDSSKNKRARFSSEILHAKSLTFYCVDSGDAKEKANFLFCKAGGTNWFVSVVTDNTGAGTVQEQLQEAEGILKSMQ